MKSFTVSTYNTNRNMATNFRKHSYTWQNKNLFSCFQVFMCGQIEGQIESQVQKQSISNMHVTANTHTTVHNVKLPVTQHSQNVIKLIG